VNFGKSMEMAKRAVLLASLVLSTIFSSAFAQGESDVAEFESYFNEKGRLPLEQELSAATLTLQQAQEISDSRQMAKAMTALGLIHFNRTRDYEKAMDFLVRSLAIEDSLHLESERLSTYIAIAKVFEVVGDYLKSAQFLEQALEVNVDERDINWVALILNNLGNVNASRGRIKEAFANYGQVLRYRGDIDKRFEAEALYILGQLYSAQGKYEQALQQHKKALAVARAARDRFREARSLDDIGEVYGATDNNEKSLANHQVALSIWRALNDKRGIAESYNHIGSLYYRQHNIDSAIANGLVALESGMEAQAQDQIFRSYELLSEAYKDKEDYKSALSYKELSLAIHEFIQNEKQERQVLETQNRYFLEKKEAEIQNLEAVRASGEREIAAHKRFNNILFVLVALGFVIAVLIFVLYLVKRRSNQTLRAARDEVQSQNTKLQELNQTKDKFFSIISHDLKGPLNSLTSFSHLLIEHTENLSKEEIQMLARDLDKSVRNLFALLENLLEWSRSQTGNIDFTPEIFDMEEVLQTNKNLLQSQAAAKRIALIVESRGPCRVSLHKQSINTVVRNLISNAIKFTNETGQIRLGIKMTGALTISVADNGVGMSEEVINKLFRLDVKHSSQGTAKEKGTGLGLILCKEFIEKNGGKMRVQSEPGKGSVFTFSFPLKVLVDPVPSHSAAAVPSAG
jgi:signal transduction histidine kinase